MNELLGADWPILLLPQLDEPKPQPERLDGADLLRDVRYKPVRTAYALSRLIAGGASLKHDVRRKREERAWTERQAGQRVRCTGRARETGACKGEAEIRVQKQCSCRITRPFALQAFLHQPSLTLELRRAAKRRRLE